RRVLSHRRRCLGHSERCPGHRERCLSTANTALRGSDSARAAHQGVRGICSRAKSPLGYRGLVLLSDRDILAELASGRVGLDPLDETMVQPSSVDVRLDRYFRLFDNHKYPVIDPAAAQPELTRLVEVPADEP